MNKGQGKHFNESEDVTNKRLIFKLSLAGFITYISKNTKVMIGYEPEELIGTHIKNIMHHEDYEKVRDKCQFEDNKVFSSVFQFHFWQETLCSYQHQSQILLKRESQQIVQQQE